MILKRLFRLSFVLCLLLCGVIQGIAQAERPRLVRPSSSRPINAPPAETPNKTSTYRPPLLNNIALSKPVNQPAMPSVKKTAAVTAGAPASAALMAFNHKLLSGIQSRLGIRYNYGSEGPNYYDCSGFVWSVFQEAGISFERSSAHTFWNNFEPVSDEDKYKFGTLVFFNRLGHMGIVADDKGFYHASSSKGITWSPFAGYWGKRVVGFRRIPLKQN